jgi:hypothetical protein
MNPVMSEATTAMDACSHAPFGQLISSSSSSAAEQKDRNNLQL